MRLAARLLVFLLGCAPLPLLSADSSARIADEIRRTIDAAIAPTDSLTTSSLGAALSTYANNLGRDPTRYESFTEAARRILAGGTPTKQPPDLTHHALERASAALLASLDSAPPGRDTAELTLTVHLARFHAHRSLAAVHYNLFKRGLRLAELLAATYREKDALAAWRAAVATAAAANLPDTLALQAELKRLERNLQELEEQCCPPEESVLREKVWQPAAPP